MGLIELITPAGSVQLKAGEAGKTAVLSATEDITTNKKVIRDGAAGLKNYYQRRYWSTPRTSANAG
jgi:hypothetical protein